MKKKLDRIESELRALFEKRLLSFFSDNTQGTSLLDDLLRVMKSEIREVSEGVYYAPDQFILEVSSEDFPEWGSHQELLDEISSVLERTGLEEGFSFRQSPEIQLYNTPEIPPNEFNVSASFTAPKPALPDTAAMPQNEQQIKEQTLPENAYFVIGGKKGIPLNKNVINIGRHSDNDLILDDLHVSRHHAQLRVINQQFVIFDVGSSSGLFLNGKKISKATLQAGDVIRLGVTKLIYVQDSTGEYPTTAMPVDSGDHPTEKAEK